MPKGKVFRMFLILLVISLFTGDGCGSANKSQYVTKKNQASKLNASQLGRNKYYFSTNYQKKLTKSYRKR
jgi:hypothetical protein